MGELNQIDSKIDLEKNTGNIHELKNKKDRLKTVNIEEIFAGCTTINAMISRLRTLEDTFMNSIPDKYIALRVIVTVDDSAFGDHPSELRIFGYRKETEEERDTRIEKRTKSIEDRQKKYTKRLEEANTELERLAKLLGKEIH